jgi:hypothetical protein
MHRSIPPMFSKWMGSRPVQWQIKRPNFFVSPVMKRSVKLKISEGDRPLHRRRAHAALA